MREYPTAVWISGIIAGLFGLAAAFSWIYGNYIVQDPTYVSQAIVLLVLALITGWIGSKFNPHLT